MQFSASLLYTTFFLLFTFCYAIFFVVVAPFMPLRARFSLANAWASVLLFALRVVCRLD